VLGFAVCIIFFLINHFAISHLDVPLNVIKLKYSDDYFMSFLFRLDQGHLVLEFTYVYNDINILGLILPLSFSMHITINNFVLILVVSCLFVQSFLLYIHKLIIFYLEFSKKKAKLIGLLNTVSIYTKNKSVSPGFLYVIIPIGIVLFIFGWIYMDVNLLSPWDLFSYLGWGIIIVTYVRSALIALISEYFYRLNEIKIKVTNFIFNNKIEDKIRLLLNWTLINYSIYCYLTLNRSMYMGWASYLFGIVSFL